MKKNLVYICLMVSAGVTWILYMHVNLGLTFEQISDKLVSCMSLLPSIAVLVLAVVFTAFAYWFVKNRTSLLKTGSQD
jgi:cytochrome c oxidase subunit IV